MQSWGLIERENSFTFSHLCVILSKWLSFIIFSVKMKHKLLNVVLFAGVCDEMFK